MAYTISYGGRNSGFQAGNIRDVHTEFKISPERPETSLNQTCMRDLRTTDPRDDKSRIEQVKGGLLRDSYRWILDNQSFKQWRWGQDGRLLWIKGDPGKGKTMLLCGIIDELKQSEAVNISFFFCQAADVRINSATAVLRGLIYLLVDKQPGLLSHVRSRYDQAGKQIFEDANAWVSLSNILKDILDDSSLLSTYLIIDALDECNTGLPLLLDFIIQNSSAFPSIKWVVSSRNWPIIEECLETTDQKTTIGLELNEASIAEAVEIYIQYQVRHLTELKRYNTEMSQAVFQRFLKNSQRTFLWVALVSQELAKTSRWNTLAKLDTIPPGLTALYNRMLDHILTTEDADLCQDILAVMLNVYQPLTLDELIGFVNMPYGFSNDYEALAEIIALCGSFLTVRNHTVSFVHQSAKEFLIQMHPLHFFKLGTKENQRAIFRRSLKVMIKALRRNMYNLSFPGFPLNQVSRPDPDPLSVARYQCFFWVEHLQECAFEASEDLEEGGLVDEFLKQKYLNWVEAISLLGGMSEGIAAMVKLDCLLKKMSTSQEVSKRGQDCYRFIRYHRPAIEGAPLQVYNSCLVFSPVRSINKVNYRNERPQWVLNEPKMEDHWSPCLQTLEGHGVAVTSVAWSPDGSWLASGSKDRTVRIWDLPTRQCIMILEGHAGKINSVVWSPDGSQLASGSDDLTVRVWDLPTRQCTTILEGHTVKVNSIVWSPDGSQLASGSDDHTARVWDLPTRQCTMILEGHTAEVNSVAWSPDGSQLASGSDDLTLRIWDPIVEQPTPTLNRDSGFFHSISWSPDGCQVASCSSEELKIWDSASGRCISTLQGHITPANSIAWSPDGTYLASGSSDRTVRIWEPVTQQCTSILEHGRFVTSIAWSPDGSHIASGSANGDVKLWNVVTMQLKSTLELQIHWVESISWAPDARRLALGGQGPVKIWDLVTGCFTSTLSGHKLSVMSISWSSDGSRLATGSIDCTVRIWDLASEQCLFILDIFSPSLLRFGKRYPYQLHTNIGVFDLDFDDPCLTSLDEEILLSRQVGYGLSNDCHWINLNGRNTLWLPPEYRSNKTSLFITSTTTSVAIGCHTGRVLFLKLSNEYPNNEISN